MDLESSLLPISRRTPPAPRPARANGPAGTATAPDAGGRGYETVLRLQRNAGNRAVASMLRGARAGTPNRPPPGGAPATPYLQRCGTERHAGCPCLEESESAGPTSVQRADAEAATAAGGDPGEPTATADGAGAGLRSELWADDERMQAAFRNAPPLRTADSGEPVRKLQQALTRQGLPMPASTRPDGRLDGVWGGETTATVRAFQQQAGVRPVGGSEAGHKTLGALDQRLGGPTPTPPGPTPPGPRPGPGPDPRVLTGSALGTAGDQSELPVLDAGPSAAPDLVLGFALPASAARATPAAATPAVAGGPAAPAGPGTASATELVWHGSTHESIFALVRALVGPDEARAAEITGKLLKDSSNVFTVRGRPVSQAEFELGAAKDGKFVLLPEAAERLAALCGTDRRGLALGVQIDRAFGRFLEENDRRNFNDPSRNTAAQKGRETGRDREKRVPVTGNRALLAEERLARIYLDLMETHAGLASSHRAKAAGGLDARELKEIIGTDGRRDYLTDLFTQGVTEQRATIGEVDNNFVLMNTLFEQVTWGNPTANRNLLHIGVGKPENAAGLVYAPDGTLYYNAQGEPLPSFAGEGMRDPGFNANPTPATGPLKFNIETIGDPVLKGFFRLLKQQGEQSSLIFRGAGAYLENMELVNARVQEQLPAKVRAALGETLLSIGLFLVVKAAIIAAERSRVPELQALAVAVDAALLGLQLLMDIDFVDTTVGRLSSAGFHLCRVMQSEDGTFTKQAEYHLNAGAEQIAGVVAEFSTALILKLGEKGAKSFLERVRTGESAQLKCTICTIDSPNRLAQQFHQQVYEERLEALRKSGRKVKKGDVLRNLGDARFPSIELHPDGTVVGLHKDVQEFHRASGTSGQRSSTKAVFESHHVFEDSSLVEFGVPRDEAWAVSLEADDHKRFTSWMAQEGRRVDDVDVLYDLHRRMYQELGHPELLAQLDRSVSVARSRIVAAYNSGSVPGAQLADFPNRRARVLKFLSRF